MPASTAPTCPVCASPAADPFVRVPGQPVHCNLLWESPGAARGAARGDIDLSFCSACGHVFNLAFDAEATRYGGEYENSLHHSGVFQEYAKALVAALVARYDLRHKNIVEIGAGQGDFLKMLCAAGDNQGTGFDPSHVQLDHSSTDDRVTVVPEFYGPQFAHHPADLVVCRHVLEHIDRSGDFLRMVRHVIADRETTVFFEVPNAMWTLASGGVWDLIYEHSGYFTPLSLSEAFRRSGFHVTRTEAVFGGQFLTLEARPVEGIDAVDQTAHAEIAELSLAVEAFAEAYRAQVQGWRDTLRGIASQGRTVVVWGAGSKGVTFLNVVDQEDVIRFVVDVNPRKQGRFVAGVGQPVIGPDRMPEIDPDVVIVMNPNYRSEVDAALRSMGVEAEVLVA